MKLKLLIAIIVLMFVSFFISFLFFLNSGIVQDFQTIDEVRLVMIFDEMDKIPLVRFDTDNWVFRDYGILKEINNQTITVEINKNIETYNYNLTNKNVSEKIVIYYKYTKEYEKEIIKVNIR